MLADERKKYLFSLASTGMPVHTNRGNFLRGLCDRYLSEATAIKFSFSCQLLHESRPVVQASKMSSTEDYDVDEPSQVYSTQPSQSQASPVSSEAEDDSPGQASDDGVEQPKPQAKSRKGQISLGRKGKKFKSGDKWSFTVAFQEDEAKIQFIDW